MMKLQKLQEQKNVFNTKSTKKTSEYKALKKVFIFIYNIRTYTGNRGCLDRFLCYPPSLLFFLFLRFV